MTTAQQIANQLGSILYWHVPQDIFRKVDEAQAVAEMHGFDAEDFKSPSRVLEVSRTAKTFRHQHGNTDKALQEVVRDNSKEKVWGILGIRNDGEKASYKQDTTVSFDKDTQAVTAEGEQAGEFMARYNRYKDCITDEDIRVFINRVRSMCHGINLRQGTGGVYFVPERFVAIVKDAQAVLDDLNVGAKIYLLPMQNTQGNREIVWESVEHEIGKDVEALVASAKNITRNVSSFKKKEDKLGELDTLMTVYRDLLGAEAQYEELAERLSDASGQVAELMTELQSTKRAKRAVTKAKTAQSVKATTVKSVAATAGNTVKLNPWVVAAKQVLVEAGVPMDVHSITSVALNKGLVTTSGKTPWNTMSARLSASVRSGDAGIVKVGKGVYEVA
jgi:hypothetical protein